MSKDYTSVLDRVSHIEQACADIRRNLSAAAGVAPASAADTEGEGEEITLANSQVADYETAAKQHFGDISNHVTQALGLVWGSPAAPSGPGVSPGTVPQPAAVSPSDGSAPAVSGGAPAAPASAPASGPISSAPAPAAAPTSAPAATPAPAADASATPAAAPPVSSTPTS